MTQITVSAGSSVNVTLPANNRIIIGGSGVYRVGPLGTSQRPTVDQLIDTTTTVGPFEDSCVVRIAANLGATYEVIAPTDALDSRGLPALVSGAGSTVAATEFPAERVSLTATGAVCASPCHVERIRCVTGTSVSLVVYDNPAASSGTQLYSGTLSAGDEAAIAAPIRAINGVRAVFASGSFDIYVSQEA